MTYEIINILNHQNEQKKHQIFEHICLDNIRRFVAIQMLIFSTLEMTYFHMQRQALQWLKWVFLNSIRKLQTRHEDTFSTTVFLPSEKSTHIYFWEFHIRQLVNYNLV